MATGAVYVKGLAELNRDFRKISKELSKETKKALAKAAEPVARQTEEYIVSGGGGFPGMRGVRGRSAYVKDMRIGATNKSIYVAPAWSSNAGTIQGAILAMQINFRMEGALEDKSDEITEALDKALGHLFDDNGF